MQIFFQVQLQKYQGIVILLNQNKLDAESHACLC